MPFKKNKDFNRLIAKARSQKEKGLPFVIYQKPEDINVKGIFPNKSHLIYTSNFSESGFVFSPFQNLNKTILFAKDNIVEVSYAKEETTNKRTHDLTENGKEFHLELVNKAIHKITNGELEKVVVSRKITTPTHKDAFELFKDILNAYPSAFKYIWFHPKVGMWLGATPETLLKVNEDALSTTSLAGTLPVTDDEPNWSNKEIGEQQLVTDFIIEALSGKIKEIKVAPVSSVKAGKLWHLKSVITGNLEQVNLGEILKVLHPTPAVCGIPKKAAKEFLKLNEGYDRKFYTGFLGELNFGSSRNTHLSVNLRCMKLDGEIATIFIGGGITKDSVPIKEWNETQHKSKTMLSLL